MTDQVMIGRDEARLIRELLTNRWMVDKDLSSKIAIAWIDSALALPPLELCQPVTLAPVKTACERTVESSGDGTNYYVTACGRSVDPRDKFCPICGGPITETA